MLCIQPGPGLMKPRKQKGGGMEMGREKRRAVTLSLRSTALLDFVRLRQQEEEDRGWYLSAAPDVHVF